MRTAPCIGRLPCTALALLGLLLASAPAARAQLVKVDAETQLRSLKFESPGDRSFSDDALRKPLAETAPGKQARLKRWFGFLPFIDPPEAVLFDPVELQRDVVRLREFYRRAGFPNARVRYRVERDRKENQVDVAFLIDEGRPNQLHELRVHRADGRPPEDWLPPDLQRPWRDWFAGLRQAVGDPCGDSQVRSTETAVLSWFRDRGYAYITAAAVAAPDSAAHTIRMDVEVVPGPRARIGTIEVAGNRSVAASVVRNTLPFGPGDWYSARSFTEGQRALINLNLFHMAIVEAVPQAADSVVPVRVRVEEGPARLLTGEAGYLSDAGLTVRGQWEHRNYFGGARALTAAVEGETGVWAIEDNPEKLFRGSLALKQPGVLHPRVSLITSPFAEYRDDFRDRSWKLGVDATLVYFSQTWLRSASLQYGISSRRVLEYRDTGDADIFTQVEEALDSLGTVTTRSGFTFATTLGSQDDPVKPRRLLLFRPSVEVTVPGSWNTAEYSRLDLAVTTLRPLNRGMSFWGRVAAGRLYPFGKSVVTGDEVTDQERYLALRDYIFTAGGAGDVRGWDNRLLGPKVPDFESGSDSLHAYASRYTPIGGFARIAVTTEMRIPLRPLGPAWGTHVFLDGGKVWNPPPRYLAEDPYDQERFFFATGFGIDRDTPVGPLRFSLGYELNPTALDVLKPQEFLDARAAGTLDTAQPAWNRRLRFHFAFGATF